MVLQNLAWVKYPLQVQARLINFNIMKQMVSNTTLQLIFNKLSPVKFCYSIKEYPHLSLKSWKKNTPSPTANIIFNSEGFS